MSDFVLPSGHPAQFHKGVTFDANLRVENLGGFPKKLPKKPMSRMKMIQELEDAIDLTSDLPCLFWMCRGPQYPRNMATCTKCWTVRKLFVILRHLKAESADPGSQ